MAIDLDILQERLGRRDVGENAGLRDERNKNWPVRVRKMLLTSPRTVTWRDSRPARMHLDQDCNGCTGWSMASMLNHNPFHKLNVTTKNDEDGRKFYTWATQRDIWPGEYPAVDEGSSGNAAAQGLRDNGFITEWRWVFDENMFWAALNTGPVSVGTNWYSGMFLPDEAGVIRPSGAVRGGHQYTVDAYSKKLELFRIDNSWGRAWGKNGYAFISRADLFDLIFKQQGDAVQLVT